MTNEIIFTETQKFSSNWLAYIIFVPIVIFVIGFISQIIMGIDFGDKPLPDIVLIFILVFLIVLAYLILSLKLTTKISTDRITVQYFPLLTRNYYKSDIANLNVIDYGFVGGWGIRFLTKHGTVYNVSGSDGLKIKLKSGKELTIGTQNKNGLSDAISRFNLNQD